MPTRQCARLHKAREWGQRSTYTETKKRECELEKLCKLILWYVARNDGVRRTEKTLVANKRASHFPNIMIFEQLELLCSSRLRVAKPISRCRT